MAYQLPLRYVKVSNEVAICATRIVTIMSTELHQARELIKREKSAKTLVNACGRNAAKSAVILDNGTVVSSPYSVSVILTRIESIDRKGLQKRAVIEAEPYVLAGADESTEVLEVTADDKDVNELMPE